MSQELLKQSIVQRFNQSLVIKGTNIVTTLDEDNYFEFKKSLQVNKSGIDKAYLKTVAGFANNIGGVIIFGVEPESQILVGIKSEFENFDNKLVSTIFSEFLDGLNSYLLFTEYFTDKLIGFLCINQPSIKPVIVKTSYNVSGESHNAGDIYFRYPGEVRKILPSDLRELMTTEVNRHAEKLIAQMKRLVSIGAENAAIIDATTGEIEANGAKLTLSSDLLSSLNLIMEGHFVETEGAPAYVIKGDIQLENEIGGKELITRDILKTLHTIDYHKCMLENDGMTARYMLENMVFMDTPYLPIYFYIHSANISKSETIQLLSNKRGTDVKDSVKNKLIEHLQVPEDFVSKTLMGTLVEGLDEYKIESIEEIDILLKKYKLPINRKKSIVRTIIYNSLINKKSVEDFLFAQYTNEIVEAFTHITANQVNESIDFLKNELIKILYKIDGDTGTASNIKTSFRKAISKLDYLYYSNKITD